MTTCAYVSPAHERLAKGIHEADALELYLRGRNAAAAPRLSLME